jgi:hypothetical protein
MSPTTPRSSTAILLGAMAAVSTVLAFALTITWHLAPAPARAPGVAPAAGVALVPAVTPASGMVYHRDAHAASAGNVDEDDAGEVVFTGHRARIAGSIPDGRAVLRYDINLSYDDVNIDLDEVHLFLRYTDKGDDGRIVARLKRLNTFTGQLATLLTLDTDDFAQGDAAQRQFVSDTAGTIAIRQEELWWVEVTITWDSPAGRPELESIEVMTLPVP